MEFLLEARVEWEMIKDYIYKEQKTIKARELIDCLSTLTESRKFRRKVVAGLWGIDKWQ